jgi:hypothetical protein
VKAVMIYRGWGLMPLLAAALLLLRDVMAPGCAAGIPVASGGWQHASRSGSFTKDSPKMYGMII